MCTYRATQIAKVEIYDYGIHNGVLSHKKLWELFLIN